MRIQKLLVERGVVYPSAVAKMLLAKEVIEHILLKFREKTNLSWENRPPKDEKCKKSVTLEVVTSVDKCYKVENWVDIDGIEGPFLMKNNIVFYNRTEKLLLVIMCPSFMNIPTEITDVWVRRVIPFTYGVEDFTVPEVVGTVNFEEFFNRAVFSTIFGKGQDEVIKLHRVYGTFQWAISTIESKLRRPEVLSDDVVTDTPPKVVEPVADEVSVIVT